MLTSPPQAPLLQLRNLTKTFREGDTERVVFRDLQAVIRRGEFVVLLGRSGSGKSTLLNLISGIDRPSAGEVHIGEVCLTGLTEHRRTIFRRENIGFIFQFYNLIPTLTVRENLLLPLELKGSLGQGEERRAGELLEQVGLADRAGSYPDRLSGGEQQRIAIARALIHRPLLLLADEPTGNLDEKNESVIMSLFARLHAEGRTILLVTHNPELGAAAERIIRLAHGRVDTR